MGKRIRLKRKVYRRPEDKTEELEAEVRKTLRGAVCWTVFGLGGAWYLVEVEDGSQRLYFLVGFFCVIAWVSYLCHLKWLWDYPERKLKEDAAWDREQLAR